MLFNQSDWLNAWLLYGIDRIQKRIKVAGAHNKPFGAIT